MGSRFYNEKNIAHDLLESLLSTENKAKEETVTVKVKIATMNVKLIQAN